MTRKSLAVFNPDFESFQRPLPPKMPPRRFAEAIDQHRSDDHPFFARLRAEVDTLPRGTLADAVHFLCQMHGQFPGVTDHATLRGKGLDLQAWLGGASAGFVKERALLRRLAVAAGPIATTLGQDQCHAALEQYGARLTQLAQSERAGCAAGAAFALIIDWHAIRPVLNAIAARIGVDGARCHLPSVPETVDHAERLSADPFIGRALAFGAAELLGQHGLFWDLLGERHRLREAIEQG